MFRLGFIIIILTTSFLPIKTAWAAAVEGKTRPPTTIKKYVKGQAAPKLKMVRKKVKDTVHQATTPEEPATKVDLHDLSELDISDIIEPNSEYQYTFTSEDSPFVYDLDPPVDTPVEEEKGPIYLPTDVDVSKIEIKGIWLLDNGQRKALIQEGSNKTTIVGVGYKIGEGRIVSIKKNEIVVGFHSMKASGVREYKEKVIYFKK